MDDLKFIPISECIHRGVYRISSRNLVVGVFDSFNNGFVGIREKFGNRYLFTELHHDAHTNFGTVCGMQYLHQLPDEIELNEYIKINGYLCVYEPLFHYLESVERNIHGPNS